MSEDFLQIKASSQKKVSKDLLSGLLKNYGWFDANELEVEQDNSSLSILVENVCPETSERGKLFLDLKGIGLNDITAIQWYDNVGEKLYFRYESGKTYEFESLEEFNAWNEKTKFSNKSEEVVLKAVKANPCYMLIKFDSVEKPNSKVISKIRQSAKVVFEECHIASSKTSYSDGTMYILYAGYIFQDYVYEMVINNFCVDGVFKGVYDAKGTNLNIVIHHEKFPVDCHSFVKKYKLKTRFVYDGRYSKSIIPQSIDDSLDESDCQKNDQKYCVASNNLVLERANKSEMETYEECLKRLLAASKKHDFRISPKLKANLITMPLIIIDEGLAKSQVQKNKSKAVDWIFSRINKRSDQKFNSGDYAIFDAVENRYYMLQDDLSWETIN